MIHKKIAIYLYIISILLNCEPAYSCLFCQSKEINLWSEIISQHFWVTFTVILIVFLIFMSVCTALCYFFTRSVCNLRKKYFFLSLASILLGGGIVGFIDGIFFHQIFQFHNLLSNQIPPNSLIRMEINMFWDGIFHAFSLFLILSGIGLLLSTHDCNCNKNFKFTFIGFFLLGGGIFNLIEGLINHHIVRFHHVIQRASIKVSFYADLLFILIAVVLIISGLYVIKKSLLKTKMF